MTAITLFFETLFLVYQRTQHNKALFQIGFTKKLIVHKMHCVGFFLPVYCPQRALQNALYLEIG